MTEHEEGSVLGGKFVVEGVLGRGGMGIVYAARHISLDQRVAIKCLLPEAMAIPAVAERFSREARAAAKIQGEHVTRVLDVGVFEDDGTPYIVMEYMQGHDLADELALQGVIDVPDAVRYVLHACEALAQAHALRIVHRDLKPANLFLAETPGRRPVVKVLDFGISKMIDPSGISLTKTASMMGTPFYMSPEQLLAAKTVDERSDIWALGIILYELLTGGPPFTGDTGPQVVAKIVQNEPELPRMKRPEIPEGLETVILTCLKSKPADRYADVAELARALEPFAMAADRESVEAIHRVLGDPPRALLLTDRASGRKLPTSSAGETSVGVATTLMTEPPAPLRGRATVHKLADVVAEEPRRSSTAWIGGGLAAVAVIAAAVMVQRRAPQVAPHDLAQAADPVASGGQGPAAAAPPPTGTTSAAEVAPERAPSTANRSAGAREPRRPSVPPPPASVLPPVPSPPPTPPTAVEREARTPDAPKPSAEAPPPPPPPRPTARPRPPSNNPLDLPLQ